MAHIDDSLKAALYRITCPDSATLGNFHLGLLSEDAATEISLHLVKCPHCTRELQQLEAFLAETAVSLQPSTAERIKIWLAKRLPTGGHANEAGDAQLSLEVQDDPEHPGRKSILGLVLGIETGNLEARLLQGDEHLTAVSLDDLGNFIIGNLLPGRYELMLIGESIEIHVQNIKI